MEKDSAIVSIEAVSKDITIESKGTIESIKTTKIIKINGTTVKANSEHKVEAGKATETKATPTPTPTAPTPSTGGSSGGSGGGSSGGGGSSDGGGGGTVTPEPELPEIKVEYSKSMTFFLEGGASLPIKKINPSDARLTYVSSDTNIVTIDTTGKMTGVGLGKTTITVIASKSGYKTKTFTINVEVVEHVEANIISVSAVNGKATVTLDTSTPVSKRRFTVTQAVYGEGSGVPFDVTIGELSFKNGVYELSIPELGGEYIGKSIITYVSIDDKEPVAAKAFIVDGESETIEVKEIIVEGETSITTTGGAIQMTAKVYPENASDKSVTWSVNNDAAMISEDGLLTAIKNGNVTVIATANDGSGVRGQLEVEISGQEEESDIVEVTGISVDPTEMVLEVEETRTITATVTPNNANERTVTWSSSNSEVAKVNNNGEVIAVGAGEAIITVTTNDGGFNATITVTVTDSTVVDAKDIDELKVALADSSIKTINITGITEALVVNNAVTINGNSKNLNFTDALNTGANGEKQGILVYATGTTINDLSVVMAGADDWQGVYGIQVYNATEVTLNNVTASGADGGILVNASEVELKGTTTVTGNEFGGIEVSKGTLGSRDSKLTVTGTLVNTSEEYGQPTIWLVKNQGTVTGTNVPATAIEITKADNTVQIQYYLVLINSEVPTPDVSITKDGELVDGKAIFNWSSINGMGSADKLENTSGSSYNYYSDGAYLALQLKDANENVLDFKTIFENITLQTSDEGTIDIIPDSNREKADWGIEEFEIYKTVLAQPAGDKSIFYGLRQSGGVAHTVGFEADTTRKINLTLTPNEEAEPGIYTLIVYAAQQGDTFNQQGGAIEYTVTVEEIDEIKPEITSANVEKDTEGNLVLTVIANDENLYSLEVDHSHGKHGKWSQGSLPEFTVYASEENAWGTENDQTQFQAAGVTVVYHADTQTWVLTFANDGTAMGVINDKDISNGAIDFYLVAHDKEGNSSGDMSGNYLTVSQQAKE